MADLHTGSFAAVIIIGISIMKMMMAIMVNMMVGSQMPMIIMMLPEI